MSQILAWSRQVTAKHALFLFDSCFSGTVFKTKALPKQPPHISRATALPVRQFITAGNAGEQVQARSVFTPAFVDALTYGWGDTNKDGYITGVELGLYLEAKVPQHAQQSPQFGKHPDYPLSRGDFVFTLSDDITEQAPATTSPTPAPVQVQGNVQVNVNAPATVYINDKRVGEAQPESPLNHQGVAIGRAEVRVEAPGFKSATRRAQVKRGEWTRLVFTLEPLQQTARLTVRSNVYDDRVYIDGQFKGSTRLDLELEPGWHAVTVEKEDYAPFEERILLASAEHRTVRAQLQRPSSIPSEAQLRRASLRQLSDDELMELHAGRTLYLEDLRAGTAIPVYFLPTGWRRLMFEGRYFEGHYWVSNDTLCAESLRGGEVCTPLFKDGDIYRLCDPRDDGECRWVIRRIEAGNPEGLQPQPQHEGQPATWIEPVTGMEFVWIPSGCIDMGSPKTEEGRSDNERQHRVCIEGFWLGKHEVTNVQYRRFSSGHDSGEHRGQTLNGNDHPVVMVESNAADAFAEWLSQQTGAHLRLPTEVEWEYAARAGTGTVRYWGDDPGTHQACAYANVYDRTAESMFVSGRPHHACEDRHAVTAPVGQFQPNAFGLYDILGNAWEWTCSVYDEAYRGAEKDCASKGSGAQRVIRGGSWDIPPHLARSAGRGEATPDDRSDYLGFRLARIP